MIRCKRCAMGTPWAFKPNSRFPFTVKCGQRARSWKTMPRLTLLRLLENLAVGGHDVTINGNHARVWRDESRQQSQNGGLPAARGADYHDALTGFDDQREIMKHGFARISLGHRFESNYRHARLPWVRMTSATATRGSTVVAMEPRTS